MGAQEFGQLVEAERVKRRWTRSKLAVAVGILDDGSALDATQIRRIVEGTRRLDQDIVNRLIRALSLDPADAWEAALESADLKPPGLTATMLRKLDLVPTTSRDLSPGNGPLIALPSDLDDELVRRLRPDRRRHDRRQPRRLEVMAA